MICNQAGTVPSVNLQLGILLLLMLTACNQNKSTGGITSEKENQEMASSTYDTINYIKDPDFLRGISLLGTDSSNPNTQNTLFPYGEASGPTIWKLAEWGSTKPLSDLTPESKGDTLIYGNEAKKVRFIKKGEAKSPQVILELLGSQDYQSVRQEGQNWPHLLLEQSIEERTPLAELDALSLIMDVALMFDNIEMDAKDFNEGLHTSQVSLYMTINDSKDFLWFGIPVYDYRYPEGIDAYAAQDLGKEDATQKFIMRIASSELFSESLQQTGHIVFNTDILPFIKKAFDQAQASGYLKDSNWSEMYMGSFNFGWETTGTFDSGLLVRKLTLQGLRAK